MKSEQNKKKKKDNNNHLIDDPSELYRLLAENVNDIIFTVDPELNFTYISPSFEKLTGYKVEEFSKLEWKDFLPPESLEKAFALVEQDYLEKLSSDGNESAVKYIEMEFLKKDGRSVWVEVNLSLNRDLKGNIIGLMGVARDISERKVLEKQLISNEKRFRELAELLPAIVVEMDMKGILTYVNQNGYVISGYTEEDFQKGFNAIDMFIDSDKPRVSENIAKIIQGQILGPNEYIAKRKNGKTFDVLAQSTPIIIDGKTTGLRSILFDISDRKQIEEQLIGNEKLLETIFDNTTIGLILMDKYGNVIKTNKRFLEVSGFNPDEVDGKELEVINVEPEESLEIILDGFERVLKNKRDEKIEVDVLTNDGKDMIIEIIGSPILKDGEIDGVVASLRDVTKQRQAERILKKASDDWQNTFDAAKDSIMMVDDKFRITRANLATAELLNLKKEDLIGKTCFELMHGTKMPPKFCPFNKAMKTKAHEETQFFEPKKDLWLLASVDPIFNETGMMTSAVHFVRDITDWKRKDDAIRASEEKFRLISENIPVGVYSALPDKHSTSVFISGRIKEISGYTAEELTKDTEAFTRIIHPDDRGNVWEKIKEHRKKKDILDVEYRIFTKDKKLKWIRDKATPVLNSKNKIIRIDGFIEDITQRKNAEEAFKQNREQLEIVINSSYDLITLYDLDEKIILWSNNRWRELLGWSPENLKDPIEPVHPKDKEKVVNALTTIYEKEQDEVTNLSFRYKTKKGNYRTFITNISRVNLHGKNFLFTDGHDITELKLAEEQIKRSLQEKEVLLQEVHHRVKNNLQVISSLLKLQANFLKDKTTTDIFKDSQNRIKTMAIIHEKLYQSKDFTRINFADYVKTLINNVFQTFRTTIGNIKTEINMKDIYLPVDLAIPCGLIINELVSNSLKHAFKGVKKDGKIRIKMSIDREKMIKLVVSDNGTGLPKRIDINKTKSLGLHLVNVLVTDQLQGKIKLDRMKGSGTSFEISFKRGSSTND